MIPNYFNIFKHIKETKHESAFHKVRKTKLFCHAVQYGDRIKDNVWNLQKKQSFGSNNKPNESEQKNVKFTYNYLINN